MAWTWSCGIEHCVRKVPHFSTVQHIIRSPSILACKWLRSPTTWSFKEPSINIFFISSLDFGGFYVNIIQDPGNEGPFWGDLVRMHPPRSRRSEGGECARLRGSDTYLFTPQIDSIFWLLGNAVSHVTASVLAVGALALSLGKVSLRRPTWGGGNSESHLSSGPRNVTFSQLNPGGVHSTLCLRITCVHDPF